MLTLLLLLTAFTEAAKRTDSKDGTCNDAEEAVLKFESDYSIDKIVSERNYYNDYVLHSEPSSYSETSSIFLAHKRNDPNTIVAVKKIIKFSQEGRERAEREARLLKFLCHDRIVKVMNVYKDSKFLMIVMEWLETDTLKRFSCRQANHLIMPRNIIALVMRQIAEGLSFLHNFNIIHRDIKPDNIMFGGEGIKLIDFGLSTSIRPSDDLCFEALGTPVFMPIEAHNGQGYRMSLDVYGLGMTMLCMFIDPTPDADGMNYEQFKAKLFERRGPWAEELSVPTDDPLIILIRECIQRDSGKRPTARAISSYLNALPDCALDNEVEQFLRNIQ